MFEELILLAETALVEDHRIDFKSEFRPEKKASFWAEIVKDIVAIANTEGGAIVFGVDDSGQDVAIDLAKTLAFDLAKIVDQIAKYTGMQYSAISLVTASRSTSQRPALLIAPARLPIVFTRVGTYEIGPSEQKTAFSKGTVYFRHGPKSEPANQDDIRDAFHRELTKVREEWLGNVRKVTEAPVGTSIVLSQEIDECASVRLSRDPNALEVRVKDLSETHPYRQNEVIKKIKERHTEISRFNSHDMQAVKLFENLSPNTHPDLIHKPHQTASPQYSDKFIDLVSNRIAANDNYLSECRSMHKKIMYPDFAMRRQ